MALTHCTRWLLFLSLAVPAITAGATPDSNDVRELRLEMRESKVELSARIATLERERTLLFSLLGLTVLSLPFAFWAWVLKAKALAQQRLEEIIESRPRALIRLLQEHDADLRLRRETRVVIVSRKLDLESVLRQRGFKNLKTEAYGEETGALVEAGAVILDLEDGLDEQQAVEVIESNNLEHVLAFCHGHSTVLRGRATFANSYMTLFSRLQELIKFRDAEEQM